MTNELLRPWRTTRTWWTLVHLTIGSVTASVAFTIVVTLLTTAASLVVLFPLAVVITWLTLETTRWFSMWERSRFAVLLGTELPAAASPPIDDGRRFGRARGLLTSAERWREVAWSILHFPASVLFATVAPAAWAASAVALSLPAWFWAVPDRRSEPFGVRIDTTWDIATVAAAGAVGLVLIAPWLTVALGNADIALARWLLGRTREAELGAQVEALEVSRSAAVDSAESERRRIERDLHDGAQQRLIAVAMDLGRARTQLDTDPDRAKELVASAHDDVKAVMKELRDLVRGIHPVILEDRGLDAALSAVVARATVPVTLRVNVDERPAPAIESAAYFIVSEALVNVDRHARATRATVEIARVADRLTIAVTDDGIGGATPAEPSSESTGLAGLADRVSGLGGWMRIISPAGGPTTILVEVPCDS